MYQVTLVVSFEELQLRMVCALASVAAMAGGDVPDSYKGNITGTLFTARHDVCEASGLIQENEFGTVRVVRDWACVAVVGEAAFAVS